MMLMETTLATDIWEPIGVVLAGVAGLGIPGVIACSKLLKSQYRQEEQQVQIIKLVLGDGVSPSLTSTLQSINHSLEDLGLAVKVHATDLKRLEGNQGTNLATLQDLRKEVTDKTSSIQEAVRSAMHDSTATRGALWVFIADENHHRAELEAVLNAAGIKCKFSRVDLPSPLEDDIHASS